MLAEYGNTGLSIAFALLISESNTYSIMTNRESDRFVISNKSKDECSVFIVKCISSERMRVIQRRYASIMIDIIHGVCWESTMRRISKVVDITRCIAPVVMSRSTGLLTSGKGKDNKQ